MHHLFIAGPSCWQNSRSAIGIYSFPLNWEQAQSESIIDPFRQIPKAEWCGGLAVSAVGLFTSCIPKPENGCINCTKPLITVHNFLSYCNPFPCKGSHFLFSLLTEIQSTVDHNLFTLGERISFKYLKTPHYFNTHKWDTASVVVLAGSRGIFQLDRQRKGIWALSKSSLVFFLFKKRMAVLRSGLHHKDNQSVALLTAGQSEY